MILFGVVVVVVVDVVVVVVVAWVLMMSLARYHVLDNLRCECDDDRGVSKNVSKTVDRWCTECRTPRQNADVGVMDDG